MGLFFKGRGDDGTTTLRDGKRINKDEPIFHLIGTLDELTAHIGLAISFCVNDDLKNDLKQIQTRLSDLMGFLAAKSPNEKSVSKKLDDLLVWIEQKINEYGEDQGTLKDFVFSGKNCLGAALDVCRTVTRRSEREAVSILRHSDQFNQKILPVLNRLSSLFFTMRLFAEKL